MSNPAANTRSRSAAPNTTPVKAARDKASDPPASVGTMMSALALSGSSPESEVGDETNQTAASLLRVNLYSFLCNNPRAHEDPHLRAEFCTQLEEYTKAAGQVSSVDNIIHIAQNCFGMKKYKLVIVGGAAVGKSALVEKLKSGRFITTYQPTCGVEVTCLVLNTDKGFIIVDIWELPDDTCDRYFVSADAFMLMYDVTSKPSTKELTELHKSIVRVCGTDIPIPMVLVGNKAESRPSSKIKVQQKDDVVKKFCRKKNLRVSTRLISSFLPFFHLLYSNLVLSLSYNVCSTLRSHFVQRKSD